MERTAVRYNAETKDLTESAWDSAAMGTITGKIKAHIAGQSIDELLLDDESSPQILSFFVDDELTDKIRQGLEVAGSQLLSLQVVQFSPVDDEISDEFINKVGETIKAMFPQEGPGIDLELQQTLLKKLYQYRTVIPLFKGHNYQFTPEEEQLWEMTRSQNSICDIIMEGVQGQVNEVVEHILHHVTDVGFHYTFPDSWGISKNSTLYKVMQTAIEKNYYNITQYQDIEDNEKLRVLLQEFAYWLIYTSWDLRRIYGPFEAEWAIMTLDELKSLLPEGYQLFNTTVPKVMVAPPRELLEKLKKFEAK